MQGIPATGALATYSRLRVCRTAHQIAAKPREEVGGPESTRLGLGARMNGSDHFWLGVIRFLSKSDLWPAFEATLWISPTKAWSRGPNALDGLPDFHFETITNGLPPVDAGVSQDVPSLCDSTSKHLLVPLCNLLSKLNDTSSSNVPPVTCMVADGCMSFSLDAAEEFGIPIALFWTPSSCGVWS
ncbi:udp-glycosyltransferase 85a2 [Quercus suber]|uniref:Udp-glycosyltransferase 85a2 n=1 Tax=Quercus suber TaxID=58331 RepID=A0AAW0LIF6_QUESU